MLRFATLLAKTAMAISLGNDSSNLVCNDMEVSGPIKVNTAGTVIENMIIWADPPGEEKSDADYGMKIVAEDVTVRNVLIYHAASAMGIYAWEADGLKLENVQVIAYGNEWGAQPCPTRAPFNGYDCTNIKVVKSDNVSIDRVHTQDGSRGISITSSYAPQLTNVVSKNPRGQQPAGQCFQLNTSDNGKIENFHCYSDYDVAWNGDSVSMWRSSNVEIRNGVVDGNNANNGICVMFEGSEESVHGGIVDNVEARNCQGCFSGYPANGLVMSNLSCAASVCQSHNPPRGGKTTVNLWAAGDNVRDGVYGKDILVENGTYYQPCDESEGRLYWESRWDEMFIKNRWDDPYPDGKNGYTFKNGGPDIREVFEWTPKEALELTFPWDDCNLEPDFIDCHDWPVQNIGHELIRENVNTGEEFVIDVWGACWPDYYCPSTEKCGLD